MLMGRIQHLGIWARFRTYPYRAEVFNGNVVARLPVCGPHDAQESGFYHRGGALLDAWDRSHHRHIHRGQCRSPSAVAVLASRAAGPHLHGISDVSERRSAPFLDFRTRIPGPSSGHAFLGIAGRVDHCRCESRRQDPTGARNGSVRERRLAGNAGRGPSCGAADIAIGRCAGSTGGSGHFLWYVAKRFCRRSQRRRPRNLPRWPEVHRHRRHAKRLSVSSG